MAGECAAYRGQDMALHVASVAHPALDHGKVARRVQPVFFERIQRVIDERFRFLFGEDFSTGFGAAIIKKSRIIIMILFESRSI